MLKRFEPLFIVFRGVNAETSHYMVLGAITTLLVDRMGELVD